MPFGLPQKTIEDMISLFEKYPQITGVKIYGSRARDDFKKGSDIDLSIYQNGKNDLAAELLMALDGLPSPYLFDVLDYHSIQHLPLKKEIDRYGKWFYRHSDSTS